MTISKKLMLAGFIGVAVLNPLSINIIADVLVVAINTGMEHLILGSGYIMAISGTLIAIGALLMYTEYKTANSNKVKKMTKEAKAKLPKEVQRQN